MAISTSGLAGVIQTAATNLGAKMKELIAFADSLKTATQEEKQATMAKMNVAQQEYDLEKQIQEKLQKAAESLNRFPNPNQ